jgi:hypothetical protein
LRRGRPQQDFIRQLTNWEDIITLELLTRSSNIKCALSTLRLSLNAINLQIPFLVIKDTDHRTEIEGYYIKTVDSQKLKGMILDKIPTDCLELKGLCRIFDDRFGMDRETQVFVQVEYLQDTFALKYSSSIARKDTPNWGLTNLINLIKRRINPYLCLNLQLTFPKKPISYYQDLLIDPSIATKWKISAKSTNLPLIYITSMLRKGLEDIREYFTLSFGAINFNYIPGTFDFEVAGDESPIPEKRYYVDIRDIEDALIAIFTPNEISGLDQWSHDSFSTSALINTLRFNGMTVPKQSLLWKLAVRLFDSCSHSPEYLSFDVGMIPLFRGIWVDFLRHIQYYWDQAIYIPNVDILLESGEVGINREFNLLHQKIAMLNCCIYRKTKKLPPKIVEKSILKEDSNVFPFLEKATSNFKGIAALKEKEISSSWQSSETDISWGSMDVNENESTDPLGRKCVLEGFQSRDGNPLWEPVVQPEMYMTDDMLEELEMILESFGDDSEGQMSRLKLQSQGLISDMMAFKAANLDSLFEDFVKWSLEFN